MTFLSTAFPFVLGHLACSPGAALNQWLIEVPVTFLISCLTPILTTIYHDIISHFTTLRRGTFGFDLAQLHLSQQLTLISEHTQSWIKTWVQFHLSGLWALWGSTVLWLRNSSDLFLFSAAADRSPFFHSMLSIIIIMCLFLSCNRSTWNVKHKSWDQNTLAIK